MRKLNFMLFMLLCAISAQAVNVLPRTVQGITYSQTLPEIRTDMSFEDQVYTAVPDGKFTFDMIESWAGEGANQAALVIQWNTGKASETTALVFGYRWDGQATGSDMIRAVVSANPQLYALIQYTNVSSPTDPNGGYTINGFGWDVDNEGPIQLRDTGDKTVSGGKIYDSPDGLFIHPRGYVPGQGGSSDYDYDNWEAVDSNDYWQAGWYTKGYWSYWCKESVAGTFSYSGVGASGRVLSNGSWDGWSFQANFSMSDWKPFEAAPAPIPADAKTEFTVNGLCYTLKSYASKTVTVAAPFVVDGKPVAQYSGEITIPSAFTDADIQYTVVGVGDGAFRGSNVTKVVLPSTVTEIGKNAFADSKLSDINIGDAIKKIGNYAFMNCAIKAPFFPAAITEIAAGTYCGSSVTSAIIPAHITTVADSAFASCGKLSEINLPKTVKILGQCLFAGCDAVTSVTTDATYPLAISEDMFSTAAYTNATLNIPAGFISTYAKAVGWSKFTNVKEFTISVNLGDKFALDGVTYIITALEGDASAKVTYCNVEGKPTYSNITTANKAGYIGSISIPAEIIYQGKKFRVTELNDSAFYGATELTAVTLPETISALPKHLFNGCVGLASINIPKSVTEIGEYAFNNCAAVENLVLPEKLLTIGRYAFAGCKKLNNLAIPVGVTSIPSYAFRNCESIESMVLGDQITKVEMYAFSGCIALKNVKLPVGLTELAQATFEKCESLTSVEIPSTVTKLGNYTFDGCKKLTMDIPQQLISIGSYAFRGCTSLTAVTVPTAITSLPNYLFGNCSALEQITMSDKVTQIGSSVFQNCSALKAINIVGGVTPNSDNGSVFPPALKNIMAYAFQNCSSLKLNPDMPAALTQIGNYAFDGMTLLSEINLPEGFKTFGQYSFRNTSLKNIVVPKSVTNISVNYAFVGCPKVYITNPVPGTIYNYTFRQASSGYVTVIVPSGTKAAFDGKSTYWKNSGVMEPELTVAFAGENVSVNDVSAELTATLNVDYADTAIPQRFRKADADQLKSGSVQVLYRQADSEVDKISVDAVVNDRNVVTATLNSLAPSTKYVYNLTYTLGGINAFAPEKEFTTTSQTTGVTDVYETNRIVSYADGELVISGYEGYTFTICDLKGAVIRAVSYNDSLAAIPVSLTPGLYVIFGKSDSASVVIKVVVK